MSQTQAVLPSVRAQLCSLMVGESYSRSERLDFDTLTRDGLHATLDGLRNALAPSVRRAQSETGNEYKVEAGEWRTYNRDIVATVIVTRTS